MNTNSAAVEAIARAGGVARLARALLPESHTDDDFRRMQHRISKWRINGVAPKWVLAVERATQVSRHELSPELYPQGQAA